MTCDCGNDHAYVLRKAQGAGSFICDKCGDAQFSGVADVFFDGKLNENLTDDMGRPIEFGGKNSKGRWMRENGIEERGDMVHGSRWNPLEHPIKGSNTSANKEIVHKAVEKAKDQMWAKYGRRVGF